MVAARRTPWCGEHGGESSVTADQHRLALLWRCAAGGGRKGMALGWNGWGATTACLNQRSSEAGKRRLPRWLQGFWEIEGSTISTRCTPPSLPCSGVRLQGTHRHERAPSVDGLVICLALGALRITFCNKRFKNEG